VAFESVLGLGPDEPEAETEAEDLTLSEEAENQVAENTDDGTAELESDTDDDDSSKDELSQQEMVEAIRALQERNQTNTALMQDFRRSVGRVQSLVDRLEKNDPAKDLRTQVDEQMDEVVQLLATLTNGLEEGILDPNTKQRIEGVLRSQHNKRERASLVSDILQQVNTPDQAATTSPDTSSAITPPQSSETPALEEQIVASIEAAGFQADDFDWAEANKVLAAQGSTALTLWFGEQIAMKRSEGSSAERRQSRKRAGGSTPAAAGVSTNSDSAPQRTGSAKFAKGLAELENILGAPL
jgi:predicted transcriptional regulator